jgi:hypothetical protein
MKINIELLKDKQAVKRAAVLSFLITLIFVIFIIICLKLGIERWKTYDDPMTWSELYFKMPRLVLIWAGLFFLFFFLFLHDKGQGRSFYICTRCLSVYYRYQIENDVCPDCGSKAESLTGF